MYKIYFDDLSPSIRFLISQDFYYLINEKSKTLGSEQPHTSPPTLASSVQDCIACADLRRRSRFQLAESGSRERVTIAVSMRPKHRSAMKHVATERVARGIYRSIRECSRIPLRASSRISQPGRREAEKRVSNEKRDFRVGEDPGERRRRECALV